MQSLSKTTSAVAEELYRITGNKPSPLLLASILDIALGQMPGPTPSVEINRGSSGAPALYSPEEAVRRAYDTKVLKGRSTAFKIQLGTTCNDTGPSQTLSIGASGSILIIGAAGVGKNAIARFLLQQYLANGWVPLVLPTAGEEVEWAGFGLEIDMRQALPNEISPQHPERQWYAFDTITKTIARQPENPAVRPVLVVDDLQLKYGSLRQIPPILSRHEGALICLEQRQESTFGLERLPNIDEETKAPVFQTVLHLGGRRLWEEGRDGRQMMYGVLWRWTAMSTWWRSDKVFIDALPRPDGRDEAAARAVNRALNLAGFGISLSHAYNLVAVARGHGSHHHVAAAAAR